MINLDHKEGRTKATIKKTNDGSGNDIIILSGDGMRIIGEMLSLVMLLVL